MNDSFSFNDLDRALMALIRNPSATPEFYRQLVEGDLWVLVPDHAEAPNEVTKPTEGMSLPFVRIEDNARPLVPLFSSFERAREAMERTAFPAPSFSPGSMPGRQILEILGKLNLRAVVNHCCRTGQVIIAPDLMRDLANETALQPNSHDHGGSKPMAGMKVLEPADYPNRMVEPMLEVLRRHRNFRAAWIFADLAKLAKSGARPAYHVLALMNPRSEAIFREFNRVALASRRDGDELRLGLIDEKNEECIAKLLAQAAPFHTATDYSPPSRE